MDSTAKFEEIVIHVCDEKKKVEKDFKCRKNILLNEMKYFEKHLKMTDSADDIDISVHCDIKIFEWLMSYLNDLNPKLEVSTVIPILISADFLIMERLIEDCVSFVVKNISEIVKIPIDMSCLNQQALKSISKAVTLEELDACHDPRDSLQSKLFSHKLEEILKEESNVLNRCIYCNTLFTAEQSEWMTCPKAQIFIDYRGRVLAKHVADKNWDINEFFSFIRKNGVSWRRIFWKVWGRLKDDECLSCGERFTLAEFNHCTYHPKQPTFSFGSNIGTFECCGSEAIRFSTKIENRGCQSKPHRPTYLKEGSLEYYFVNKHKDLLSEPVKSSESDLKDNDESKTEVGDEVNLETNQADPNQANNSVIKSQRKKMRLMSLMELLNDYSKSKSNKGKKRECEKCKEINGLCNRCCVGEDEDDNEEDDFDLVNPKFNKNSAVSSSMNSMKKAIKDPVPVTQDPGTTAESKKIKMKNWKLDFYRTQDRDKMDLMKRKLIKMRKRNKSSSGTRKIGSSHSKVSHKTNVSTNKASNRKNSKKGTIGSSNRRIIK